jgi:hypothetical protein
MPTMGFAMPILPGKADDARRFGREITTKRMREHIETHKGSTMHRESIFFQHTSMGDLLVDIVEADDLQRALGQFVGGKDPYTKWVKDQFRAITGIDFNQPPPLMPEQLWDWQNGKGRRALAFAVPVAPGKTEDGRRFAKEAYETRRKELEQSRFTKKLTRESGWLNQTPMGDIIVVLLEGDDPVQGNREFAASKSPYDLWFKEQASRVTGIDFNQPLPSIPELVFDFRA